MLPGGALFVNITDIRYTLKDAGDVNR